MPEKTATESPSIHVDANHRPRRRPTLVQSAHRLVKLGPLLILAMLMLGMFIATPAFLTVSNLGNVGTQAAVVAILGIGQFFVIITQGIDLSIGSVLSLATVTGALAFGSGASFPLVLAAMLGTGLLVGLINGIVLVAWKIPHPFIVTLGMLNIAAGVALLLSDGSAILGMPSGIRTLGSGYVGVVPVAVLFTGALVAAAYVFSVRAKIGRWLFAVGGNSEAARRAGIPVAGVLVLAYAISGLFGGLGAVVIAGRTNAGYPTAGLTLELDAIAAVIIGGTSFFGGRGSILNVIVGALILAVIRNGLNLLNVTSFWQQVAIGAIVVIAVGIDVLRRRLERHFAVLEARAA